VFYAFFVVSPSDRKFAQAAKTFKYSKYKERIELKEIRCYAIFAFSVVKEAKNLSNKRDPSLAQGDKPSRVG